MKKTFTTKLLSVMLVALTVLFVLPFAAFAADGNNESAVVEDDRGTPNATVEVLDPITLTPDEHDYMCWPSGDSTVDRPLQIVMNFKANETMEEAMAGPFADFKCDFYLEFSGLANGSIVADDCYLAGNYGSFGWIVIPTDGLELEEGISYPVVSAYDANLKYAQDICGSVKEFTAAIYVAPAILEANPDFKVSLSLKMTNPEDENDVITVGEPAVYDVQTLRGKPNATVSVLEPITLTPAKDSYMCWPSGDDSIDRPLQIVMNFKANETQEEAEAGPFADFACDFYLEFNGLENDTIVADGCYLAGNYGSFGWIVIPTDGLEIEEGVSYPVVAIYDAYLKYAQDICGFVKNFTAAIYIAPEILEANPNFKVSLSLKMTNPNNENDVITVGSPAVYDANELRGESGTSWRIENGVLYIDGSGYMNNYSSAGAPWQAYADEITSVVIGEGIKSVGKCAFYGCENITSVSLPTTLNSINAYAFYGCSGLTEITVPASVTSIKEFAFRRSGLTAMSFETNYGWSAGADKIAAAELSVNGAVAHFKTLGYKLEWTRDVNAEPETSNVVAIGTCGAGIKWTLDNKGILSIEGEGVINNFTSKNAPWNAYKAEITEVVIGEGITKIGKCAFYEYTAIKTVSLPSTLTGIGEYAFYGCKGLATVTVPASVDTICAYAFRKSGVTAVIFENVEGWTYGGEAVDVSNAANLMKKVNYLDNWVR